MLVISNCTKHKAVTHARQLTVRDFADPARRQIRQQALVKHCLPAAKMYTGQHHLMVMGGIEQIRQRLGNDAVELRIVSAGYGLLRERTPIAPYDATFNEMTKAQARQWAEHLQIAGDVRQAVRGHKLVLLLMPAPYVDAIAPPLDVARGQRLVCFAAPSLAPRLVASRVTVVAAGAHNAKRFGATVPNSKGRMFALLASAIARQGHQLQRAIVRDGSPKTVLSAMAAERRLAVASPADRSR